MTISHIRTISGHTGSLALANTFTGLSITGSGSVAGAGGGAGAGGQVGVSIAFLPVDGVYNAGVVTGGAGGTGVGNMSGKGGTGGAGGVGVSLAGGGAINNYGTISGGYGGSGGAGVTAGTGGDGGAAISAAASATVANYGVIAGGVGGTGFQTGSPKTSGANGYGGDGVDLLGGGSVINKSNGSISGYYGVNITGAGSVFNSNYGTISGSGAYGVYIKSGAGLVQNQGAMSGVELGANGGVYNGASGAITGKYQGVFLAAGGYVYNAGAITGHYDGVLAFGSSATVVNAGTITGSVEALRNGLALGDAIAVQGGGAVYNYAGGVISGAAYGVYFKGPAATLVNAGSISGGFQSIVFKNSPSDRLVEINGSTISGMVRGGGGTLELAEQFIGPGGYTLVNTGSLATATGTITGLGGKATVSGPESFVFNGFNVVQLDAGADWVLSGTNALVAAVTLNSAADNLSITGSLGGLGSFGVSGGTTTFEANSKLSVALVTQSGTANVVVSTPTLTFAGAWNQLGGALSVSNLDALAFTGSGSNFKGTLTGLGSITMAGGSNQIYGATISVAQLALTSGETVTLVGTITNTTTITDQASALVISGLGATLSGSGQLRLQNGSGDTIVGKTSSATLTNASTIVGNGNIGGGQMKLVNQASGQIIDNLSAKLTIDTGSNTVVNQGAITAAASGGVEIVSAVNNTGTMSVSAGALTLDGAVSGTGSVQISGGATLDAVGALGNNVTFTGSGVLELGQSQSYAKQVTGFSASGATSLALEDIHFVSGQTTASFASGVLTVTNGTATAHISLAGSFSNSTFHVSQDAAGGTAVVATNNSSASPQPFVQAMAAFGAGDGAGGSTPLVPAASSMSPSLSLAAAHPLHG